MRPRRNGLNRLTPDHFRMILVLVTTSLVCSCARCASPLSISQWYCSCVFSVCASLSLSTSLFHWKIDEIERERKTDREYVPVSKVIRSTAWKSEKLNDWSGLLSLSHLFFLVLFLFPHHRSSQVEPRIFFFFCFVWFFVCVCYQILFSKENHTQEFFFFFFFFSISNLNQPKKKIPRKKKIKFGDSTKIKTRTHT